MQASIPMPVPFYPLFPSKKSKIDSFKKPTKIFIPLGYLGIFALSTKLIWENEF